MGFILRSVFWLTLASIIVPAEARFGYDAKSADAREGSFSVQMHDTAYAVWGMAAQLPKICDTNPGLCAAGENLVSTVSATGASLLKDAQSRLSAHDNPHVAEASPQVQQHKKFQARIE